MWDQSDEDHEVPDAGPPRVGGNLVRQWPEPPASEMVTSNPTLHFESFSLTSIELGPSPEPESNNDNLGLEHDPGDSSPLRHRLVDRSALSGDTIRHGNHSIEDICSDTSSQGELSVTNPSLPTESSIETGLTARKPTEDQPAFWTPYHVKYGAQVAEESDPIRIYPPRPSALGRGQHGWSTGTSQPRQHHVNDQRYALPPPLRSPPAHSARPRHVSQPVSRPELNTSGASPTPLLSVDLNPPSLENSSENDPPAYHHGCPPECRRHSYSAVLFYADGDEELAYTVRRQLEQLLVSRFGVQELRVRVALFPHVSPSSTPAGTFAEIMSNEITPYIFILHTVQYQNSNNKTLGDQMITETLVHPLTIIQICFGKQNIEKYCRTRIVSYDNNSSFFQNYMRALLQGRFLDERVKHDKIRKKCQSSRTKDLGPILPTRSRSDVLSSTPHPKAPDDRHTTHSRPRKPRSRQGLKTRATKDTQEESSATSSSGHRGDISNNSDSEPVLSSETERKSWLSDVRQRGASGENDLNGFGNKRSELTHCPGKNGGQMNSADSRSGAAPTDSGLDYTLLQRENGNSSDTQFSSASNTKEDIIPPFNRVSSSQSSESAVSDEGRFRQVKKRQIDHFNSSSNIKQKLKQNRPVTDESSSSQNVVSDSSSHSIKFRASLKNPDSVKRQMNEPDGHLQRAGNSIATQPPPENSQDRNHRARESATSLPSPGSRPSVFPQSKPLAVVFPRAPESEDLTTNNENTLLMSYVREARHETEISLDRQNRAGGEQDPRSSVNPDRTVTSQEDITDQAPLENAQDRNDCAPESATSLPSLGSRPSVFPRLEPFACVSPFAHQSADQTADDENTRLKSYVTEAQNETDISPDRQNMVACEQDPQSSANPYRTVTLQEDITGRARHDDTHQQHIFSPQPFHTIPQHHTVSPQQSNASSRQHHVSHEQPIVSPEQRTDTTHQLTNRTQQHIVSPQHHSVSQGQELSSSQQHNSSSGQHAVSHQGHNTSPQQANENPQQQNTTSEHHIVSPQEHNVSFQQHTVSPQDHNISPQGHNASIEQPSACPQQYACGQQQDASPRNSSASAPKQSSTSHILDKNGCSSHAQATSPPEVEDARYDDAKNCRVQVNDRAARRRSRVLRLWERVRSLFASAPSKKKKKKPTSKR